MVSRVKKFGRRYPWGEWLARGEFTLRRGRDYDVLESSVGILLRRAAKRHGYAVQVTQRPNHIDVVAVRG